MFGFLTSPKAKDPPQSVETAPHIESHHGVLHFVDPSGNSFIIQEALKLLSGPQVLDTLSQEALQYLATGEGAQHLNRRINALPSARVVADDRSQESQKDSKLPGSITIDQPGDPPAQDAPDDDADEVQVVDNPKADATQNTINPSPTKKIKKEPPSPYEAKKAKYWNEYSTKLDSFGLTSPKRYAMIPEMAQQKAKYESRLDDLRKGNVTSIIEMRSIAAHFGTCLTKDRYHGKFCILAYLINLYGVNFLEHHGTSDLPARLCFNDLRTQFYDLRGNKHNRSKPYIDVYRM